MKKILIVVVLAAAALVAYNVATTGRITLVPSAALSAEDRELRDLEQRFESAKAQFAQAHRAAAVGGVDTTGDVEATQVSVRRIGQDLASLRKRLTDPSSIRNAKKLYDAVVEFSQDLQ